MNTVKNLRASFINHNDVFRPSYTGWTEFLNKYIQDMPALFTSNYVFEFYDGKVRMQHLMSTPMEDAAEIILCPNPAILAAQCSKSFLVMRLSMS